MLTAEGDGEQSGSTETAQQADRQTSGFNQPTQQRGETVDPDRVDELEKEVEELRERLEDSEPPEPDFECANADCEGFAIEELEPEHVKTQKKIGASNTVPKVIICPRCGEKMKCSELVDGSIFTTNEMAGKEIRDRFEEHDCGEVLEEADSKWL